MKERKKIGIDPWSIKKYWKDLQPPDINKIKASKSKFYDETFPPNKNSLISKKKNGEFVDKVRGPIQLQDFEDDNPGGSERLIWKRVTDISPKWEIFEEKIEFKDVLQGSLGDCYFLSSITALSEYPFLIREKFRTRKFNEEGYYEIVFFIDGEWQIIFLDDYFPYDPEIKNFAFAQPNNNELWAILLEKGWAKINGGYSNIIGGIVSEPICALTGFPTEFLSHKELEEIEIFDKIEKGDKEGTIMSSASKGNDEIEERQLVRSHAYTLISAKKWKERNLFLLKLRNPWGEGEWNGNWSDDSQCWTDEYKEYFDYKLNNDGIFWIDISDYVNNFDSTYICYILYGSIVRNFYFEYQSYFKKPVIFNMKVKEKSKMSVSILFKSWRFNREIADLSHPFSLILCKYDNNRRIEKLWGNWSCKDDISIIDVFEPGYYIIWLYLATKGNNDPDFRYTVQVSSLFNFDIEFLGLDHNYLLIQYLLLENYKKTGETNIQSSKDYFIGSDRDISKIGLSNLLLYNKTPNEIEVMASEKSVLNVQLLPPYEGLKNIKLVLPPYESVAIVGIRLTNNEVKFGYGFQLSITNHSNKNIEQDKWKKNNGDKFEDFLKFNINNNPESMGLRTGQYKYVGKDFAQRIPKFDPSKFIGKSILEKAMKLPEQTTLESLKRDYPKEMELLLNKEPLNKDDPDKKWDCISNNDGKYIGQINSKTGKLEGKGVFIWNHGEKFIGNWKDGSMNGEGDLLDKDNKLIFKGNYLTNKKYGQGKLNIKDNEFYEGEFFDDKMEGKGSYHYENGDVWEGDFKNNMKNGVGIMTYHDNKNDIFLYEFENDNYMGATKLDPQEKAKVKNLQQEERKKLLEEEKLSLSKRESELIEEQKEKQKIESGLNKYTHNLFLQKSMMEFGFKITQMNQEVEETQEEKRHRRFLENVELYKKKEPFMMEKFFELKPLDYEEQISLIKEKNNKYLGGLAYKKDDSKNLVMQGRGVLYNGKYYYVGYWDDNKPNGYFNRYNNYKSINFQVFFLNDFTIDPDKKGRIFFKNGEKYKGYFKNNKMHGFGTYYFPSGNSFSGTFSNGKFDGTGKYFYNNGLITEIITYKNNEIISKSKKIREDYRDPNSSEFFKDIKNSYPGVIEHILEITPLRDSETELYWIKHVFNNGDIYIGQFNTEGKLHGRCCIIYKNSPIKYFVGYLKNKEISGEGACYDLKWKKIYEGKFEHNQKSGFGILKNEDGSTYAGEFINDKPNGKGVLYFNNKSRFEGSFVDGYQNDKGYLITGDYMTIQEIVYNNGNIIEQGEIIDYHKGRYRKEFQDKFLEFERQCKENGYEQFMNLMMNIKATKDTYVLKKGIKEEVSGIYIGEMNSIGFKYGRGVFIDNYTNTFYVGYFVNNEKFGKGINYYSNGKKQYIGEYRRNKPIGKGEFKYENGEVLQGVFNSVGEGKGVYTFEDGAYWRGNFYAWTLNGKGTYFTKEGYSLGEKAFEFNQHVDEKKD